MQVEHKTEKGIVLFVKVPDDAKLFELSHFNYQKYEYVDDLTLLFVSSSESQKYNQRDRPHRLLPPGKWELIGIAVEVTYELAYQMGFDGEIEILDWPANTDMPITREISPQDEFKQLIKVKGIQQTSVVLFKPNEK